jgi:hypothetical protein
MKDRVTRKQKRQQLKSERATARAAAKRRAGRIMGVALGVVVSAGLGAGLLLGAPRLQAQVAQRVVARPVEISIEWPRGASGDSWLPRDIRDVMLASAHAALERHPDPFAPRALGEVGTAVLASGWLDSITRVERTRAGGLHITGVWRMPTAVVRREGSDYLIGRRGEILPMVYKRDGSPLKAIVGAALEPRMDGGRPAPGEVWPGADLQAGLELLVLICSRPWADQVAAIDVSEYLGRKELVLVTKWNGKVVWGGGPSDTIPGQLSTAAKLGRLDALHARYARIDVSKRLVDVTSVYTMVEDTATANAQP